MYHTIKFHQLPPSIQKAYGDGSTIHEIKAWDDNKGDKGSGFKIILKDGTHTIYRWSRLQAKWYISTETESMHHE